MASRSPSEVPPRAASATASSSSSSENQRNTARSAGGSEHREGQLTAALSAGPTPARHVVHCTKYAAGSMRPALRQEQGCRGPALLRRARCCGAPPVLVCRELNQSLKASSRPGSANSRFHCRKPGAIGIAGGSAVRRRPGCEKSAIFKPCWACPSNSPAYQATAPGEANPHPLHPFPVSPPPPTQTPPPTPSPTFWRSVFTSRLSGGCLPPPLLALPLLCAPCTTCPSSSGPALPAVPSLRSLVPALALLAAPGPGCAGPVAALRPVPLTPLPSQPSPTSPLPSGLLLCSAAARDCGSLAAA